ncbi:hypothetical protein [Natronosalvus amylolyticus]|uniref:hypothetical protein n=1 Tax=Natronosalvus amylolyticus TaxID=2961994 RepID=UPI0020C963AE|nr:hypothetical protein [Natronosalvus amylolyticus]
MSADTQPPMPIAHGPQNSEGVTLTRRRALQALGAATVTAGVGTASSGTVAADNSYSFEGLCETDYSHFFTRCLVEDLFGDSDEPGPTEVDVHVMSVSEWESFEAHHVTLGNHVDDMTAIARLDARSAVADAYESGKTASEAWQDARDEIRDYFAAHQKNHLQVLQKTLAQHRYSVGVVHSEEDIADDFLDIGAKSTSGASQVEGSEISLMNESVSVDVDLVNQETEQIEVIEVNARIETYTGNDGTNYYNYQHPLDPVNEWSYSEEDDDFNADGETDVEGLSYTVDYNITSDLVIVVQAVDYEDTGLGSQQVFDAREWRELWDRIEALGTMVPDEFSEQMVEDLYAGLDDGAFTTSDLRSAEGEVRYRSGDAEPLSGAYMLALYDQLDLAGPDLSTTGGMKVTYTGATEMKLTEEGGERTVEYVEPVEDVEYEGILFSSDVPEGGFHSGETYHTDDLEGTTEMVPFDQEPVPFFEGEFTIESIYDSDGNELDTVEWRTPEPETYTSDDFVEYVNNADETREELSDDDEDDGEGGDDSLGFPSFGLGLDLGSGEQLLGLGIIAAVVMAVVGFVTDLLPWT